jgi:hypothetical protein
MMLRFLIGIGMWVADFRNHHAETEQEKGHKARELLPEWKFYNVAAEHNKQMAVAALRYPDVDAAVENASSHDSRCGKRPFVSFSF